MSAAQKLSVTQSVAEDRGPDASGDRDSREPIRFYEATSRWGFVDLQELWRYRELIVVFALRDLKVRYRQTFVGVAWALITPLTSIIIFSTLFGLLGRKPVSDDDQYALIAICGLLPWQLFAGTLTQSSATLVANQAMLTKVYFPRIILLVSTLITGLVDFAIACVILIVMLFMYGITPTPSMLLTPLFVAAFLLASLAVGLWLSALNVLYRDIGHVVPFLIQIGFYLSPVVYESNALIPEKWRLLYSLNPMVGLIDGFRWSVLGRGTPPVASLLISAGILTLVLLGGLRYFHRTERILADRI